MNKSLKFLAIGLALAVLLVSQVGVDRSAVAHEADPHEIDLVSLDQDEVMFVDAHGQEKMFYKFGDTVHFLLRDNDLAQDTSRFKETVTWLLQAEAGEEVTFNLVTGAIGENLPQNDAKVGFDGVPDATADNVATTTDGTVTAVIGTGPAATVTFRGTDFPPADNRDTMEDESDVPFGSNAFAGGFQIREVDQGATPDGTATSTDNYDVWERGTDLEVTMDAGTQTLLAEPAALTPLVEKPVVQTGYQTVTTVTATPTTGDPVVTERKGSVVLQTEVFVLSHSVKGGTFNLLKTVPVSTTGCTPPSETSETNQATGTVTTTTSVCRKVVQATFNYHIVDVFKTNQNLGTGADDDENRALVTTSSSPSGKWVTIREVKLADLDSDNNGTTTPEETPQSNYYYGSITLVDDSGTNDAGTGGRDKGNIYARDGDTITVQVFEKDHSTEVGSAEATADGLDPTITGVEPANNAVLNEASPVLRFTVGDDGSGFDTGDFDSHVDLYLVSDVDFEDEAAVEKAKMSDDTGCKIDDDDLSATSLNEDEMTVQFRSRQDWGDDERIRCGEGGDESRFLAQDGRP